MNKVLKKKSEHFEITGVMKKQQGLPKDKHSEGVRSDNRKMFCENLPVRE